MSIMSDWRRVLHAEKDGGFREHIQQLTARRLRVLGFLGPTGIVLYVLLHVVQGRVITTVWGTHGIVIWDKVVIFLITASLVPLARTAIARRHGRWVAVIAAILAALASVQDDVMGGDASFSAAWVSLFLVIAASAMPLNPRQTLTLSGAMILAFVLPTGFTGSAVWGDVMAQMVFLISIALCITVVSMLLYRSLLARYLATEQAVRMSIDLADKAERIQNLERMKSRFFTGITHDIRTPLSLVLGPLTDVLDHHGEMLDGSLSTPLHIARRNAERLRLLVDDLLDLAQLEERQLHLHRRPRELRGLLDRWILDLQPLAEREGVTLRLCVPDNHEPVAASVDPDRMEQVVQNLVGNAIAHTPRDGQVDVSLEPVVDGVTRIHVTDSGPGIPQEHLPHVFDRFYRASGEVPRSGRGLGLAIAQQLTELHDGRLSATSRPGNGSTFTIELPASADTPVEIVEEQSRPHLLLSADEAPQGAVRTQATADLPHVLVVDDNDDMRRYLRFHLESQYRISEATDGHDALETVRTDPPELVLSDVVMPGLDGYELCRAIRSEAATSRLPVVLLTAQGGADALKKGHEARADAFLVKPFNADALLALLENLIELRRMLAPPSALGPTEVLVESADQVFVEGAREVVERHLANSNFGVDWLADEVGMHPRTLQRRLRSATRLSAAGFIRMLRLGRAAQLLAGGATNVSETAYAVGFQDVDHFTRIFRQTFGVLPSEYARGVRDDGSPGS